MSDHLDRPTGDSAMGVVGFAGLLIVGMIVLLMRAPSPGEIAASGLPPTSPVTVSVSVRTTTTTEQPSVRWTTRSTNYCHGTTTAAGTRARDGVVAVAMHRFADLRGSTWRILTGPLAGKVVTVEDKGLKARFDVYVASCTAAIRYGLRTITVERVP